MRTVICTGREKLEEILARVLDKEEVEKNSLDKDEQGEPWDEISDMILDLTNTPTAVNS